MNLDEDLETVDEVPAPLRTEIPPVDRELLELAARALGAVRVDDVEGEEWLILHFADGTKAHGWNSLRFYDDSFELATDLGLQIYPVARTADGTACSAVADCCGRLLAEVSGMVDVRAATARAVTRAAADIYRTRVTASS